MISEGNEPVVRTIYSCSVSDFNLFYAGIGCCSASNKLKCMHFKENKGNEDLKAKNLYEGSKRYIYLIKESIAGLVLHVGLVHHKLVYTKFHPGFELMWIKPYFSSSHCQLSQFKIDFNRFWSKTSALKKQGETPTYPVDESWYWT